MGELMDPQRNIFLGSKILKTRAQVRYVSIEFINQNLIEPKKIFHFEFDSSILEPGLSFEIILFVINSRWCIQISSILKLEVFYDIMGKYSLRLFKKL